MVSCSRSASTTRSYCSRGCATTRWRAARPRRSSPRDFFVDHLLRASAYGARRGRQGRTSRVVSRSRWDPVGTRGPVTDHLRRRGQSRRPGRWLRRWTPPRAREPPPLVRRVHRQRVLQIALLVEMPFVLGELLRHPERLPAAGSSPLATGSACSDSAATTAWPDSCTATLCFSSAGARSSRHDDRAGVDPGRGSKSSAVMMSRCARTALSRPRSPDWRGRHRRTPACHARTTSRVHFLARIFMSWVCTTGSPSARA